MKNLFLLVVISTLFFPLGLWADQWVATVQKEDGVVLTGEIGNKKFAKKLKSIPEALQVNTKNNSVLIGYAAEKSQIVEWIPATDQVKDIFSCSGWVADFDVMGSVLVVSVRNRAGFSTSEVLLYHLEKQKSRHLLGGNDNYFYNFPRIMPCEKIVLMSRAMLPDIQSPRFSSVEVISLSASGKDLAVITGGMWAFDMEGNRSGHQAACPQPFGDKIAFLKRVERFEQYCSLIDVKTGKIEDLFGPMENMTRPQATATAIYYIDVEPGNSKGVLKKHLLGKTENDEILARDVLRYSVK